MKKKGKQPEEGTKVLGKKSVDGARARGKKNTIPTTDSSRTTIHAAAGVTTKYYDALLSTWVGLWERKENLRFVDEKLSAGVQEKICSCSDVLPQPARHWTARLPGLAGLQGQQTFIFLVQFQGWNAGAKNNPEFSQKDCCRTARVFHVSTPVHAWGLPTNGSTMLRLWETHRCCCPASIELF